MISGVAFVPSTPMLVPSVAAGAVHELDLVRDASIEALRQVCRSAPERVVVVGAGTVTAWHSVGTGSLHGFGVELDVALDPVSPSPRHLPLAHTIGAWLLAAVGWPGDRVALELDPRADAGALAALGEELVSAPMRTVLLVVADGSAARSEQAPASLHPQAASFDAAVAAALRAGDPVALAGLDRDLASDVSAGGWPAWQVAAVASAGGAYDASLLVEEAPYGVGYLVATWLASAPQREWSTSELQRP